MRIGTCEMAPSSIPGEARLDREPDSGLRRDMPTDVLCVSSIDWDFIWQGHQEVMATLAERGHRVLFLENTGVRPPKFQDWPRLRRRQPRCRRWLWRWLA